MFDRTRSTGALSMTRAASALLRVALLVATAVTGAAPAEAAAAEEPAPIVFVNGQVFTAEHEHPYAESLAVKGDRIIAVGALASVLATAGPGARKVDLKGKFLMPGMLDAHAHPVAGGLTLIQANFPDTKDSVPDLVHFVAEQLKTTDSRLGDVLVVNGIDIGFWSHAAEINAALSGGEFAKQPIVLFGSDGHTAWANAFARTRAGITPKYLRSLKPLDKRYFGFDAAFNPNGFVVDAGKTKLDRSLPKPSAETMLKAGRAAVHYMNGLGITGGRRRGERRRRRLDSGECGRFGVFPRLSGTRATRGIDGARRGLSGRTTRSRQPTDRRGRGNPRQIQRCAQSDHSGSQGFR